MAQTAMEKLKAGKPQNANCKRDTAFIPRARQVNFDALGMLPPEPDGDEALLMAFGKNNGKQANRTNGTPKINNALSIPRRGVFEHRLLRSEVEIGKLVKKNPGCSFAPVGTAEFRQIALAWQDYELGGTLGKDAIGNKVAGLVKAKEAADAKGKKGLFSFIRNGAKKFSKAGAKFAIGALKYSVLCAGIVAMTLIMKQEVNRNETGANALGNSKAVASNAGAINHGNSKAVAPNAGANRRARTDGGISSIRRASIANLVQGLSDLLPRESRPTDEALAQITEKAIELNRYANLGSGVIWVPIELAGRFPKYSNLDAGSVEIQTQPGTVLSSQTASLDGNGN